MMHLDHLYVYIIIHYGIIISVYTIYRNILPGGDDHYEIVIFVSTAVN